MAERDPDLDELLTEGFDHVESRLRLGMLVIVEAMLVVNVVLKFQSCAGTRYLVDFDADRL